MAKPTRVFTLILRMLAFAATLSSVIVMVTSHETTSFFGLTMDAKFQYTPSFEFLVIVNAIGCVYTLLALVVPPTSSLSRWIVFFDVMVVILLTAGISAAGAIAQVGKRGNTHAGWLPICGQVAKFCHHVMGALAAALCGVVIQLVILLHTVHTVISPLLP